MKKTSDMADFCRTIGQLETHIINLNGNLVDLRKTLKAIQTRVMVVEKQHAFIRGCMGVLITVGAIFGAAVDHLLKWILGR